MTTFSKLPQIPLDSTPKPEASKTKFDKRKLSLETRNSDESHKSSFFEKGVKEDVLLEQIKGNKPRRLEVNIFDSTLMTKSPPSKRGGQRSQKSPISQRRQRSSLEPRP